MKRTLILFFALVLLLGAFSSCAERKTNLPGSENAPAETGEAAKGVSFTARDFAGELVNEQIFAGKKVTMLNIWASYCGPCLQEMPELEALSNSMGDDFQIIGVCIDAADRNFEVIPQTKQEAEKIIQTTGVTYRNLLPSKTLNELYLKEVQVVPTTYFVDEAGRILEEAYFGARTESQWRAIAEELLRKAG